MPPPLAKMRFLACSQNASVFAKLTVANSVSDDGRVIVGNGKNPDGQTEGWIATIPDPRPGPSVIDVQVAGGPSWFGDPHTIPSGTADQLSPLPWTMLLCRVR